MAASYGNVKGSGHDGHLGNSPATKLLNRPLKRRQETIFLLTK